MKRVFICSPYEGDIPRNVALACRLAQAALQEDAAPFVPHLLYPQIVTTASSTAREQAGLCGLEYLPFCDEVWVYAGVRHTFDMRPEINFAKMLGKPLIPVDFDASGALVKGGRY